MATTINGNYFVINEASVDEAEGVFNIELGELSKSAGAIIELVVSEAIPPGVIINLPSAIELKGYPGTTIRCVDVSNTLSEDASISIVPANEEAAPVPAPAANQDAIGNLPSTSPYTWNVGGTQVNLEWAYSRYVSDENLNQGFWSFDLSDAAEG